MPITFDYHPGAGLYAQFDDAGDTCVELAEGAGLKAGLYTVADADLLSAGLPAGDYLVRARIGDHASPSAADPIVGVGEFVFDGATEVDVVDVVALAAELRPHLLPTDVEGAHVPGSRTASLVRVGDKLYSETPLPIAAGESGPLFAASFAKDLAGGGSIYQVVSIEVVSKPAGAGDEDLVIVGDFKRNGPEARFVLAAAADAVLGRYTLAINVVYAGGAGPATALVDVNVGSASS